MVRRAAGLRALAAISVVALAAACAGREPAPRPAKRSIPDPFASLEARAKTPPPKQAGPRWETVLSRSGSGNARIPFLVDNTSIQSRVQYSCEAGSIRITTDPAQTSKKALTDEACPSRAEAFFSRKGAMKLLIDAGGPWQITIQQQVTTPLDEPLLPEMTAAGARVAARGDFYRIERDSSGKALLYRLANGRLALRMEDFDTSANTDLYVWLSAAAKPETSEQALNSVHEEFSELKSTLGNQNYLIDPGALKNLKADQIRSIVIWCQPVRIAYAGASLAVV